ncbi:MAG: hypothetical protein ACE5K9_10680 [Candidatus Methylomirabilales bacterium]
MARALTKPFVLWMAVLALLVGAGAIFRVRGAEADGKRLEVDVACDANTFAFEGPTNEEGGPAYGASFVVQGVIYPEGTFEEHGSSSGLLPNGEPEFPELVIGKWTCKGWFIGDGIATQSGPFVVTTQIYDLDPGHPGAETLVSEGIELIDPNVPFLRAVTGGTGQFKEVLGEVAQTSVGVNATGLFNFTFEFDLED